MSWLRELQILTMLPQIWLYANTNHASYYRYGYIYKYICVPTEICIAIQMKLYGAAIIINNARNYILAFKIWQTNATNIHVTVQLISKLTLVCGNMCMFLYFCQVTRTELACDTRVIFRVEHASSISCAALHEIHLRVLHDCKKHASNILCAARESVFLCAAHKLTAILYQRRIKAYNEMVR